MDIGHSAIRHLKVIHKQASETKGETSGSRVSQSAHRGPEQKEKGCGSRCAQRNHGQAIEITGERAEWGRQISWEGSE